MHCWFYPFCYIEEYTCTCSLFNVSVCLLHPSYSLKFRATCAILQYMYMYFTSRAIARNITIWFLAKSNDAITAHLKFRQLRLSFLPAPMLATCFWQVSHVYWKSPQNFPSGLVGFTGFDCSHVCMMLAVYILRVYVKDQPLGFLCNWREIPLHVHVPFTL